MKKTLSIALASTAICVAVPAGAADMAPRMYSKAAPYVNPVYNWTGFYIGAHVGYAWGEEHDNLSQVLGPLVDNYRVEGVIGGVHAGYNWQAGAVVFGLEGDFDGSGVRGSQAFDYFNNFRVEESRGTLEMRNDWQASIRGRLGYAANNWLFYATGGVAFADVTGTLNIARTNVTACEGICVFTPFVTSDRNTLIGYTVGVGTEYAFSPNWITRAEVRYTDFGSETYAYRAQNNTLAVPTSVRFDQVHATLGISYKF